MSSDVRTLKDIERLYSKDTAYEDACMSMLMDTGCYRFPAKNKKEAVGETITPSFFSLVAASLSRSMNAAKRSVELKDKEHPPFLRLTIEGKRAKKEKELSYLEFDATSGLIIAASASHYTSKVSKAIKQVGNDPTDIFIAAAGEWLPDTVQVAAQCTEMQSLESYANIGDPLVLMKSLLVDLDCQYLMETFKTPESLYFYFENPVAIPAKADKTKVDTEMWRLKELLYEIFDLGNVNPAEPKHTS